jgi:quercetin dioxygenase-like cupin family protein
MKLLATTVISLALLASASAHANHAGAASGSGAAPAASVHDAQTITITRSGSQPFRKGPAEYFTGSVRIDPLFQAKDPSRTSGSYVTFEPSARSAWHTYPLGQTLIVTAGTGWVQQESGEQQEIKPSDVIWIPPGVKHWHSATATNGMTHIAIQEEVDGKNVEWMEKVSDEQYGTRSEERTGAAPAFPIQFPQPVKRPHIQSGRIVRHYNHSLGVSLFQHVKSCSPGEAPQRHSTPYTDEGSRNETFCCGRCVAFFDGLLCGPGGPENGYAEIGCSSASADA